MKKRLTLSLIALLAALSASAFAQGTAAPATAQGDPIVEMRAEQRAARKAYSDAVKALKVERKKAVTSAGDAAFAEAKAQGKDPSVARRDAEAKAKKATKADYDAKVKALAAERKTALDAAAKKAKAASQ